MHLSRLCTLAGAAQAMQCFHTRLRTHHVDITAATAAHCRSRARRKGTALPRQRIVMPSRPHELCPDEDIPQGHLGTMFDLPNRIGLVDEVMFLLSRSNSLHYVL